MKNKLGVLALACFGMVGSAMAGTFSQSPDPHSVTRGDAAGSSISFSFAGDGDTQDAQLDITISDVTDLTITPTFTAGGAVCQVAGDLIRVVPPSGAGTALPAAPTVTCTFSVVAAAGAALGTRAFATDFIECTPLGAGDTCTFAGGGIVVGDAPVVTPPTITGVFNGSVPASPITGTTRPVGVVDFSITSPAANGGTGSVSCVDDAGGPTLSFAPANQTGITTTVQDVTVSCGITAAAQSGTFTCTAVNGGAQTFTASCPAGTTAPPVTNAILVPANSLWSKLGLVALLAALGAVFVALRRNH